ncbi:hypothetical protein FB451DRAFT_1559152 [Mycena latifolia]|nr:hypothetical protein FB451DRAFT_1559152 [Mycena latifolia]
MQQPFLHLLPHDVLYELFVLCVQTTPDPWFPVVLSQVCHSWRFTALASPALWTTVVFRVSRWYQRHLRAEAFLERSRGLPISVHIHLDRHPTRRVGSIVLSNAVRLRCLTLTSQNRDLIMDCVGFFAEIPFHAMELFHVVIPGEMDLQIIRKPDLAIPFFTPYPTVLNAPSKFLWFSWIVQNVTSLSLKGLGSRERPSMEQMWSILAGCRETLRNLDFEGWAPSTDAGSARILAPITFPRLRSLRLGYLDDISSLAACIVAPRLQILVLHDVLFCPTMLLYPENTHITRCNVSRVFRALVPSCTRLTHLALVGVDACARDTVDMLFDAASETTALVLSLCHPSISDRLFQPEARYCTAKAVLPKLRHLTSSLTAPIDFARLLLRHKTAAVAPLKRLDIFQVQLSAAYSRPGICSILAVVLEMNVKEGMLLSVLTPAPKIHVAPVAS